MASRDARLAEADRAISERDSLIAGQRGRLQESGERIAELERLVAVLSDRVVAREAELRGLREELARRHGELDQAARALGAVADELAAIRAQARGQATRIRLKALRDATEITDRIAELAQRPAVARERLLEALGEAITKLGGRSEADASASANGHDPDAEAGSVFQGLVEVEVGPLSDFAQLVGFEDAASGIGATSDISVKRFAKGRATIEMNLREPVELLRELEERSPFEFRVRDTREDRVVLDVDAE